MIFEYLIITYQYFFFWTRNEDDMFQTRATVWSFQLVTSFLCYSIIENRTTAPTVIKLLPKPDKVIA